MELDYSFTSTPSGWERTTTYPSGDELIESTDFNGRTFKSEIIKDGVSSLHHHNYTGGIYRGRRHDWSDRANGFPTDPMVFNRDLDGFGRPVEWTFGAVEFQNNVPAQGPSNADWADLYCGGEYDASRCGKPLLKISAIRDVMGRVASLNTRFNHPMADNGVPVDDEFHWDRWRGYTYTMRGFLARSQERETQGYDAVDTQPLNPNAIDNTELNRVGIRVGAESWLRNRDIKIGSMNQIRLAGASEFRWKSTRTRGAGHRLRRINVDGQSYTIQHDEIGRSTRTLDFELQYDAANRLTEAHNPATGALERYAYDGQGRLAYVHNSEENTEEHFGYDGPRMVVAMDKNNGLLWQSFQGPNLDSILEFHDASQAIIPILDHRKSIAGAWDMTDGSMVGIATYDTEGRVAQYSNDEALECNEVGNPGVNCSAPGGLPFGLNARWRSPMTGFVNMHHRWYSPRMGEFLSHDPLGYFDSYNLFGFATYDPINGYDPFGLETKGFSMLGMGDFINDEESLNQLNELEAKIRDGRASRLTGSTALEITQIRAEAWVRQRKRGNYFSAVANLGLAVMDSFAFAIYDEKSPWKTIRNIGISTAGGAVINKLSMASKAAGIASSASAAGALKPNFTPRLPSTYLKSLNKKVSRQKQPRHLLGEAPLNGKSYVKNMIDAQSALDAVHSGDATFLGTSKNGHKFFRFDGVNGTHINIRHHVAEPTNVFFVKAVRGPQIVPSGPYWPLWGAITPTTPSGGGMGAFVGVFKNQIDK